MLDRYDTNAFWETLPNLETVTLNVRTSSTTPGTPDTFTAYTLFHALRRETTRLDAQTFNAVLSSENLVFELWQDDLDNAGVTPVAQPFVSWVIADQSFGVLTGTTTLNGTTITGIVSTTGFIPGMAVVGSNLPAGTTITTVGSGQVTVSQGATAAGGGSFFVGENWLIVNAKRSPTRARWDCLVQKGR